MKISKFLLTSTLASSIALVGVQGGVDAEEKAKTVWGQTLPSSTDPDGDGWANGDFDPSVLPQSYQEEIKNLTLQKDSNQLSQSDYNEKVANIYEKAKQEQQAHQTTQGERPYGGVTPDGMTHEEYKELEKNVPKASDVASVNEYNRIVNEQTQAIANKNNHAINTPQQTFEPQQNVNQNANAVENQNNNTDNQVSDDKQVQQSNHADKKQLPSTGEKNNYAVTIGVGILSLILGVGVLLFRRVLNK